MGKMNKEKKRNYDIYDLVSKNIKYYRKKRKLTQANLAELTEYSHEFIRRIEAPRGKKNFSLDTVNNIANALDIDISLLLKKREQDKDK